MKKVPTALAALGLMLATAHGANRMRVTFTGYTGNRDTLRDFPALVVFTNNVGGSTFDFTGTPFANNGHDLRFYDADGTLLDYEFDTRDPQNEILLAWVKVPVLRPDGTSYIIAEWGDANDADQLACTTNGAVWADGFLLVHHYNEPNGSTYISNATSAARTDVMYRSDAQSVAVHSPGIIGKAANLENPNSADRDSGIRLGPAIPQQDLEGVWTMGAWIKSLKPRVQDWRTLFRGDGLCHLLIHNDTDRIGAWDGGATVSARDGNNQEVQFVLPNPNTWHYIVAVCQGNTTAVYLDGDWIGTIPRRTTNPLISINFFKNYAAVPNSRASQQFAEYLDEVRVATRARSGHWVWAEFQNQRAGSTFATYEVAESTMLAVEGVPDGVGLTTPALGWHYGVGAGSNIQASASWWMNPAGDVVAVPTHWKRFEDGVLKETNTANPFTYIHPTPAVEGKIVWHFALSNLISAVALPGGSVEGAGWCAEDEWLEVEAVPVGEARFLRWEGDVPTGQQQANPLRLDGDTPKKVTAVFAGTQYVAPAPLGNDGNHGFSLDKPKLTIQAAVAMHGSDGGLVLVTNGTYNVGQVFDGPDGWTAILLNTPVVVRGMSGNPNDVIVQRASGTTRVFALTAPGARVENLTMRNGNTDNGGNLLIRNAGTVVSNCVITAANVTVNGGRSGGIHLQGGLVTHCVISNNTLTAGYHDACGGVRIESGRLEHCLVVRNTASLAETRAGGVRMFGGQMVNCTVVENSGNAYGGVYADTGSTIINTVIAGNSTRIGNPNPDQAAWGGNAGSFNNCFTDTLASINTSCTNFPAPGGTGLMIADISTRKYYPAPGSPLIGAAIPIANMPGVDLAGKPRERLDGSMDAGCYQADLGQFAVTFTADKNEVFTPALVNFNATVSGTNGTDEILYIWDFGDGNEWVTNTIPDISYPYPIGGFYTVVLVATNNTVAGPGATMTLPYPLHFAPPKIYVDSLSATPSRPYDDWTNALRTVQAAVDFAVPHCEIFIKAGTYAPAAWVENSGVRVNKPLRIFGDDKNPAGVTLLGSNGNRALLVNHPEAWVGGVTLANGANVAGAGVYFGAGGGVVSNCVIRNNNATSSGGSSVARLDGLAALLTHCAITNNTVYNHNTHPNSTLVIYHGLVENCLIAGNTMTVPDMPGGRTSAVVEFISSGRTGTGKMRNCTLAGNDVSTRGVIWSEADYDPAKIMHCVIAGNINVHDAGTPAPLNGWNNNITDCSLDNAYASGSYPGCRYAEPSVMFKMFAAGDYRLGPSSPAINAGPVLSPQQIAAAGVDLDGKPRVVGTRMDHGCYESPMRGTLLLVR